MSGFAAVVVSRGRVVDPLLVVKLQAAIAFRGPDGSGQWSSDSVALVHSLLKTTDEGPGVVEPLSLTRDIWIVADARIDGRAELLRKLGGRHSAVGPGTSDAELILRAYHKWGEGCVEHLIGDYAFAIWDETRQRLFCARDHFGVVPCYYSAVEGGLAVSNTMAALRQHPDVGGELNELAIADYLLVGHTTDPAAGFFRSIHRLPPGHLLVWCEGKLTIRRYWSPPEPVEDGDRNVDQFVDEFRSLFDLAVADRLRCDRVAVTLSGGMDSGMVCATTARLARERGIEVDAYTIALEWLVPNEEREYAQRAASWFGIPFHALDSKEWFLTPHFEKAWRTVPEPRFELRRSPTAEIGHLVASRGGRVVLSGFGGDVLLSAPATRWADLLLAGRLGRFISDAVRYKRHFGRRPPVRRSLMRRSARSIIPPLPESIAADFAAETRLQDRYREVTRWYWDDPRKSFVLAPFWSELFAALDPESSRLPVRARHPFADLRLLDLVLRTPPVPLLINKTLLRTAGEGALPPDHLTRRKTPLGESTYYHAAVRGHEPWLEELALTDELGKYVNRKRLLQAVRDPRTVGPYRYNREVLFPVSLGHWLREQGQSHLAEAPVRQSVAVPV